MGGPVGLLDALFGYNKPGHIGFGSQKYAFKPYDPVTAEQAKAWGMTYPETVTTPAYEKPWPTSPGGALAYGPPEMVPEQQTTRDVPIPGIVGMRLGPKEKMALFQEQLKERRELAKLDREQQFWKQLRAGQGSGAGSASDGTFALDGTGTPAPSGATGAAQPAVTPAAARPVAGPVPGIEKLSPQFRAKAQLVANRLGINLDDFYRVMHFETGGEFSPATRNRAGSGATGLIQFMPDTAKGLGTTTDALAKMTPEQQLDYVEKYLAPHKGKLGNLKDLYMAILYPAAVGKAEDTVLFTPQKTPKAYLQNAALDTDKKGYVTVGDAVAAVQRTTGVEPTTATAQTPVVPAPAGTPAQPGTSQMVAGPGAPAPAGTPVASTTGTRAPSTPAATAPTVTAQAPAAAQPPATAQEPFQLSTEGRTAIERNNKQTMAINVKLQQLRADQEQVLSSRLAGTPRGTVELQRITTQITELEKDKNKLLEDSQALNKKELEEYRKKGTKAGDLAQEEGKEIRKEDRKETRDLGKEGRQQQYMRDEKALDDDYQQKKEQRVQQFKLQEEGRGEQRTIGAEQRRQQFETAQKALEDEYLKAKELRKQQFDIEEEKRRPGVTADVEAAKQNVQFSEKYRQIARELAANNEIGSADPTKLSVPEQAKLSEEERVRDIEDKRLANLTMNQREAFYRIQKDENIRPGRATNDVFDRAGQLGREQDARELEANQAFERNVKLDAPLGDNAAKMYRLDTGQADADTNMTRREAQDAGYRHMTEKQAATIRSARRSMMEINRMNVMLFGGEDDAEGTLTGKVYDPANPKADRKFIGIYPALEKASGKDLSGIPERFRATMDLRMQYLTGKTIGEWAAVYSRRKEATLAMVGRQIGGDTGHFTDADARRADGNYARLFSQRFGIGPFDPTPIDSHSQAKKQMKLLVAGINDTVRSSLGLDTKDVLPWDENAAFRPNWKPPAPPRSQRQAPQPARGTTATRPEGDAAMAPAPRQAPPAAAPTPPAPAQEPVPGQPVTQEPAPAQTGQAPKPLDGPTATQHLKQAIEELFPGRTPQSLSVEEKRQLLERARAIGTAAGFSL